MSDSFSEIYRQVNEPNEEYDRPTMALVVVDAQNDFSEGGSLAVDGALEAYRNTYTYVAGSASKYSVIVTTKDNHIDPGAHFSSAPDYVDSWPVHCAAGTSGAEIHADMQRALDFFEVLNPHAIRIDVTKGEYAAAYSGFEGKTAAGVSLADALHASEVDELDVVGVATDFCVRATVLDALDAGFSVRVLSKQVAGVSAEGAERALAEMAERGAVIV